MRKLLSAVFVLLFAASFAAAQTEPSKAELFGGYSYLRVGGGDGADSVGFHGFNTDFTGYLNPWFGITGAVSGHYKSQDAIAEGFPVTVKTNVHTFAVGPRVRFNMEDSPITPFAHALFGASRESAKLDIEGIDLGEFDQFTDASNTDFSMIFGGGVDWKASDVFSIRLAQVDVVSTRRNDSFFFEGEQVSASDWQNNFRYSGGIVIRF